MIPSVKFTELPLSVLRMGLFLLKEQPIIIKKKEAKVRQSTTRERKYAHRSTGALKTTVVCMLVTIGAHGIEREGPMAIGGLVITSVAVRTSTVLGAVSVKRDREVLRVTNRAVQRSMAPDQFGVIMGCISRRSPAGSLMTGIALECNPSMVCRLSGCSLSVVTGRTLAGGTGIMNIARGDPSRRSMTGVALCRGLNMVLRLARGFLAVMTSGALAGCAGIVNIARGDPSRRLMTSVALCRGHKMVLRFAGGGLSVVASRALARYQSKIMIKGCRRPSIDGMTEITTLGRHDMILRFSVCDLIIMAIFTLPWSRSILPSQMTLGTFQASMGTKKLKRSSIMIEIGRQLAFC
ncbi:MAG: hypothetical protein HY203_06845 [Nitrospirae bacterium]|nr:hypothetical protein [Nitrospirota bacterium]